MLETPRLIIRPFSPSDGKELYAYLSDPEVVSFEPYPPFSYKAAMAEAVRRSEDPAFLAVCLKPEFLPEEALQSPVNHPSASGVPQPSPSAAPSSSTPPPEPDPSTSPSPRLIGNLWLSDGGDGNYELGFVFNRSFWGKGYACEASLALLTDLMESCEVRCVIGHCNIENRRSQRLLERLGFKSDGGITENIWFGKSPDGQIIVRSFEFVLFPQDLPI